MNSELSDHKLTGWDIGVVVAYFLIIIGTSIYVNYSFYDH
jgi:hypothetical protein